MDKEKVDRLSGLSAIQIAGLAVVGSTIASVMTLFGVRRLTSIRRRSTEGLEDTTRGPDVAVTTTATIPDHFSEDIVVPGLTYTGTEVQEQDERHGRSSEGV